MPKTAPIPVFALARKDNECFDCFVSRSLIAAYDYYKDAQGLNHKEVAESLGIPRASLYSRLSRARAKLETCPICQG
jgi:hypothetical protein